MDYTLDRHFMNVAHFGIWLMLNWARYHVYQRALVSAIRLLISFKHLPNHLSTSTFETKAKYFVALIICSIERKPRHTCKSTLKFMFLFTFHDDHLSLLLTWLDNQFFRFSRRFFNPTFDIFRLENYNFRRSKIKISDSIIFVWKICVSQFFSRSADLFAFLEIMFAKFFF